MKAKCLRITWVVGMLAALPAYANLGINNATYAARHQSAAQATPVQANPTFQVAVLATSPSGTAATKRGLLKKIFTDDGSHPWGPARPYALKSH
jgi:hypothetical protein